MQMQMLSSEQNEDWLKQEAKAFQNQFENENNIINVNDNANDFGLDITSWTNNKQKKQQKQNNQKDIEKYYRKKDLKKRSQLDQIVMYNQLAFSSSSAKKKQPLQKYQTEEKAFFNPKSRLSLQKKQKCYQIQQIQPQSAYFQNEKNENTINSSQTFSECKNLLNQNKTSFKKISQKSIFMNIICAILLILANIAYQNEFNFLIVGLLIVEIIFCIGCHFINSILIPYNDNGQKSIKNKQKQNIINNVQFQQIHQTYTKIIRCIQKRLSFYQLFIYGIILVYLIIIFNMVSQVIKTEQQLQFLSFKTLLVVLLGFLNFRLVKQIKKVLFLEKQIRISLDYKRYHKQKQQLQSNLGQDQFDFS